MGVLKPILTLCPEKGQSSKMLVKIKWILRREMGIRPPFDECLPPIHELTMNIIA